jgi:membrane protein
MKNKIARIFKFITDDIWRIAENRQTKNKIFWYRLVRTFILTFRAFKRDALDMKASALTYSVLLAIIPTLALVMSVARGFGFQYVIEELLIKNVQAQSDALQIAFEYVNSYMEYARGGVFIGIGVIILLISTYVLYSNIENTFNNIWQVKNPRKIIRRLIDFLAFALFAPIVLIVLAGFSVYISSSFSDLGFVKLFSPVITVAMKLMPYFASCLLFTLLYIIIPNTKVKFKYAMFAGILAGIAFQAFQMLYINGQILMSSYSKIYGNMAAIPLLLLWLNLSFFIFLFGGEFSYASQHNKEYDFEADVQKVTRRYKDFLYIVILQVVIQRFDQEKPPPTIVEISEENHIPLRLVSRLMSKLLEAHIVTEAYTDDERVIAYLPAFDINKLTVGLLLERLEKLGSEHFNVDRANKFKNTWAMLVELKNKEIEASKDILIKDLK